MRASMRASRLVKQVYGHYDAGRINLVELIDALDKINDLIHLMNYLEKRGVTYD